MPNRLNLGTGLLSRPLFSVHMRIIIARVFPAEKSFVITVRLASKMSDAVVDLVREGCETLEFQVGEINPHSVGHVFQVLLICNQARNKYVFHCYFFLHCSLSRTLFG